eukprot:2018906-Pleurochrysis_carterae.AAC.2
MVAISGRGAKFRAEQKLSATREASGLYGSKEDDIHCHLKKSMRMQNQQHENDAQDDDSSLARRCTWTISTLSTGKDARKINRVDDDGAKQTPCQEMS